MQSFHFADTQYHTTLVQMALASLAAEHVGGSITDLVKHLKDQHSGLYNNVVRSVKKLFKQQGSIKNLHGDLGW